MPIRVLHCPTDTGRNAWTLAQAEKRLGLESTVLVYHRNWFNYPTDIDLKTRELSAAGKARAIGGLLLRAAHDYDVIHFNAGRSLMPSSHGTPAWLSRLDLRYFKALGKGIVVTYQGCDVRQRGYCAASFGGIDPCSAECATPCSSEYDAHKARLVKGFERYADAIYSVNPDLLNVLPERAEFLPYTTVDLEEWKPSGKTRPSEGPFTIVHAPTARGIKGTRFVIEAVEALKKRHPEVELALVENMTHDEVRRLYERADVVVDQLLAGWYGGFAVEAMALGKPVVCYIRETDLRFIPDAMREDLPFIQACPGDILDVLEATLARREELAPLGRKSRAFVERWHDPMRIAARTKDAYESILAAKGRRTA